MSTQDLDISIGQAVNWYGNDGCIMDIDGETIIIEVCGKTIMTDADELVEQNIDLLDCGHDC